MREKVPGGASWLLRSSQDTTMGTVCIHNIHIHVYIIIICTGRVTWWFQLRAIVQSGMRMRIKSLYRKLMFFYMRRINVRSRD